MNTSVSGPQRTVEIHRGLFLVRYTSADVKDRPPTIRVLPRDANAEVILHPDTREASLFEPGTALVVRAVASTQLTIEIQSRDPSGSIAATVKIEPLSQGFASDFREDPTLDEEDSAGAMRILGHVAGIGDVLAEPNAWIAGPSAPSRIEGLAIEWQKKPRDLDLRYAVKFAKGGGSASQMVSAGTFAGTRGRALPLVGVVLEVVGKRAKDHQLRAEALFLGSPVIRASGSRIVLSGPTGREPLVGLRLNLVQVRQDAEVRRASADLLSPKASQKEPSSSPLQSSGQVRVFRSSMKSDPRPLRSATDHND